MGNCTRALTNVWGLVRCKNVNLLHMLTFVVDLRFQNSK